MGSFPIGEVQEQMMATIWQESGKMNNGTGVIYPLLPSILCSV
jgi:hypothetical protein